ncbi:MAG: RHS repeat protein, partial [Firmicutes bacterium]|nr:RHS repeat protein [Bacillota bacterium]
MTRFQIVRAVSCGVLAFFACIVSLLWPLKAVAADSVAVESPFWVNHFAWEYGLSNQEIRNLRGAGMSWTAIADYLESLYPHPPLKLNTQDFVDLATRTGIEPVEAIRAYDLAIRHHKDPVWLASLYQKSRSWGKIEAAFARYEKAQEIVRRQPLREDAVSRSRQVSEAVAEDYGVAADSIRTVLSAGMDEQTLIDLLFWADASSPEPLSFAADAGQSTDPLPEGWRQSLPDLGPLHRRWPERSFPQSLLPLKVPAPSGEGGQLQGGSAGQPSSSPAAEPEQPSVSQSTSPEAVVPQTAGNPPPSVVDPGSLYSSGRVSPFKVYFEGYVESIDPSSGALILRQTDFTLPGRNGLDFSLTRIYNSQSANFDLPRVSVTLLHYAIQSGSRSWSTDWFDEKSGIHYTATYTFSYSSQDSNDGLADGTLREYITAVIYNPYQWWVVSDTSELYTGSPNPGDASPVYAVDGSTSAATYLDRHFGFGVGWALGLPSLEMTDGRIYLHREDGATCEAKPSGSGFELVHYGLEDIQLSRDTSYNNGQMASSYRLLRKDGVGWYFGSDGRLLGIRNRFGDTIRFEHQVIGGVARVWRIWDTVGRKIEFAYSPAQVTVSVFASGSAANPEFTWTYLLTSTSHTGKQKLAEVIAPQAGAGRIRYEYQEASASFTPYVQGSGSGAPVSYDYLNLTAVFHPAGGATRFTYQLAAKDLEDDDPSTDTPSVLQFYRVGERWDEVPTVTVSAAGTQVVTKENGRSRFTYGSWEPGRGRYSTSRQGVRPAGENGIPPTIESWEFDREHQLCSHEMTGSASGADRLQPETVRTDYAYFFRQLPTVKTVTIRVGGHSRTEVTRYSWDKQGNLLAKVDPLGRRQEYKYDGAYALPELEAEFTDPAQRVGRFTQYTLSPDKKRVEEIRTFMGREVVAGEATYSGPTMPRFGTGDSWMWSPERPVHRVELLVYWYEGWFSSVWYSVLYKGRDEPDVAGSWRTAVSDGHDQGRCWWHEGRDSIVLDLPAEGLWDIRVRSDFGTIGVESAQARGWLYSYSNSSMISGETFTYDPAHPGNLASVTVWQSPDGSQRITESQAIYAYDSRWQAYPAQIATTVTKADGSTSVVRTSAEYDALGRIITFTSQDEAAASSTNYAYDRLGRLTRAELPPQHAGEPRPVRTREYLDAQRQVILTDELGHQTRETYDGLGRSVLAEWKDATGQWHVVAHTRYDSLGLPISDSDALLHETRYEYDAFGRKIKTVHPDGAAEESWYVNAGPLPATVPALPAECTGHVRWEKSVDAEGHPVYRGYDAADRLLWAAANPRPDHGSEAPAWETVVYRYDSLDRLTEVRHQVTSGTPPPAYEPPTYPPPPLEGGKLPPQPPSKPPGPGLPPSSQPPQRDVTFYTYALPFDQPTSVDLPGDTEPVHTYAYNARGLRVAEDAGTADEVRYEYDQLGRMRKAIYRPGGADRVETWFLHDKDGHVVEARLFEGGAVRGIVSARYNLRGWLEQESWLIDGSAYTLQYGYDQAGNRTSLTYPDGTHVAFEYDERDQLIRIPGFFENQSGPRSAGFRYDANGFLTGMSAINGAETTFTPDVRGRLLSLTAAVPGVAAPVLSLAYTYTPAGNVASLTDASGAAPFTLNYGYDGAGRLASAQVHSPTGVAVVRYAYDGAGNRVREVWSDARGQISYTYLPGNYLQSRSGGSGSNASSSQYTWGAYGQLEAKQETTPSAGTIATDYVYDPRRLLSRVAVGGAEAARFEYDALGRRVKAVWADGTQQITLY